MYFNLSGAYNGCSFNYTTKDGSAIAGINYVAQSGEIVFAPKQKVRNSNQ